LNTFLSETEAVELENRTRFFGSAAFWRFDRHCLMYVL
jgi:hypothetical protein